MKVMGMVYDSWGVALAMVGAVTRNEAASNRAGYDIWEGERGWISDLETRLEVNLHSGRSFNIWYED